MPAEMNEIIYYVGAFLFVLALILIGARLIRGAGAKNNAKGGSFLRGRERRLGVVEAASVDGRRKLILLRRDNVEHLIMTGGPVDVVVETGIESSPPAQEEAPAPAQSSYEKPKQPVFEKPADDGQVVIARDNEQSAPSYERET